MEPAIEFNEANTVLKSPPSMGDKCLDLHVWKGKQQDGTPVIISKFKPSIQDLQELVNNDGCIYVYIIGEQMPPIQIQTQYPFYASDNPPDIYKDKEPIA